MQQIIIFITLKKEEDLLRKIKDATQIYFLKNINYGAVKYCSFASINQTKKSKICSSIVTWDAHRWLFSFQ